MFNIPKMNIWIVFQVISAYDVYLNSTLVIQEYQVWRLITNFFYFGKLGMYLHLHTLAYITCILFCGLLLHIGFLLSDVFNPSCWKLSHIVQLLRVLTYRHGLLADLDFLFHMFFLARYCKLLEETSFRGRTADFFFMLLFGGTLLTIIVVGGGMLTFAAPFADILFLSNSLTFMMVCVYKPIFRGFNSLCLD